MGAKGDLERVTKVYNKMELFARGVYKNNPTKQAQAMETVDRLADALEAKNVAGAQASYNDFLKVTSLKELFKGPKGSNYHLLSPSASMAANEADHKGWCDKALTDAKQKRDYAAREIRELNGQMADLESVRDKLTEETTTLQTEMDELDKEYNETKT